MTCWMAKQTGEMIIQIHRLASEDDSGSSWFCLNSGSLARSKLRYGYELAKCCWVVVVVVVVEWWLGLTGWETVCDGEKRAEKHMSQTRVRSNSPPICNACMLWTSGIYGFVCFDYHHRRRRRWVSASTHNRACMHPLSKSVITIPSPLSLWYNGHNQTQPFHMGKQTFDRQQQRVDSNLTKKEMSPGNKQSNNKKEKL